MLDHRKINSLDDFFLELNKRPDKCIFFYRINGYSEEVHQFILKYYETARRTGAVIEGRIPNPDDKNLAYYSEIMGMDFVLDLNFIETRLKKWLPRMNDFQRKEVSTAIFTVLEDLRKAGKNDNMLKNAYIKFMCWLYYKFERVVNQLGDNTVPKILYEGSISNYEFLLINVLAHAGCDIVLLQYAGDAEYLKLDQNSKYSDLYAATEAFPEGYSLKSLRDGQQRKQQVERLYKKMPEITNCTNAWIKGNFFEDIKVGSTLRGNDPKLFYNLFVRVNGVPDKALFNNDLHQMYLDLKTQGRRMIIIDHAIPKPTAEEINGIHRSNYERFEQLVMDMSINVKNAFSPELQVIMNKAFVDTMLEAFETEKNLNRLLTKAVHLLCWLNRYQTDLFGNWKKPEVSSFIFFGACKSENEVLFLKMLSKLPTDVLILATDLDDKCTLTDKLLYEENYSLSMKLERFPQDAGLTIGTVAYHAERELDTLMYQDSGMYRDMQYADANAMTLKTMYEEISVYWDQEVKFRPNFSTTNERVNMPVFCAKVSGVKDGNINAYWRSIKELLTPDTTLVKKIPYIDHGAPNPVRAYVAEYYKNGKLNKTKIKNHEAFQYGYLREDIQDYMLEKLRVLIEDKIVKGTFENGTEYMIVGIALNLPKEIVRQLQKFDFTKKNPKLVFIDTVENLPSIEDAILVAYLNLLGFDILYFSPTGYLGLEKHYNRNIMEEHQIGEFMYDLQVPDFDKIENPKKGRNGLLGILFNR